MKNIILIGASRAGKSTFTKMLLKKYDNCMLIRGDLLRIAYRDVIYKDPNAKTSSMKYEKDYINYVLSYYDYATKFEPDYIKILDTVDFEPKDYNLFKDSIVICLGYPNISKEEAVNNWRKYDTEHDWTKSKTDKKLLEFAEKEIKNSKYLEKECKKYNIKFIDTSYDREKVLKDLLNTL